MDKLEELFDKYWARRVSYLKENNFYSYFEHLIILFYVFFVIDVLFY